MNIKQHTTPKNIFILLIAIYSIVRLETFISRDNTNTTELIRHMKEKEQLNNVVDSLNNQIHNYEIKIIQNHLHIDTMSNDELDSTWTNIFG